MGCLAFQCDCCQQVCLFLDLGCPLYYSVLVYLVEQQQSFGVYCLAPDSCQCSDCCVSCVFVQHHGFFSFLWMRGAQTRPSLISLWDTANGRPHRSQPAPEHSQQGFDSAASANLRCCATHSGRSANPAKPRGRFDPQEPPPTEGHCLRMQTTGAAVTGGVASSQVSPVRAPQALSRSERRLDGSSGAGGTPADAGDALAASTPPNSLPRGAAALARALGHLAGAMGSEVVRCASWDVAPVDAEGVPC